MKLNDEERRIIIGALQDRQARNPRSNTDQSRTYRITEDLIDRLRLVRTDA